MRRAALKVVPAHEPAPVVRPPYVAAMATAAAYQLTGTNRCPHCSGTAFHVGRVTAECGACGNPLPIGPTRKPMPHPSLSDHERI